MEQYNLLMRATDDRALQQMSLQERQALCAEIRHFLIASVSHTGGHLASNLGVVELTVALSSVFHSTRDRMIYDVGHQSYVHKLLTGRQADFISLRQFGGLSGFQKPSESPSDPCITGHASASVSVALGMARARTLRKEKYAVVAILGDGALTGGMAYEALNDAGGSGEPLIVVLNDNNMSIDQNVGGLSRHLSALRVSPRYLNAKNALHSFAKRMPAGKQLVNAMSNCKRAMKAMLLSGSVFEQMGFTYLGPVDGHDLSALCELFTRAKALNRPVLIHAMTQKGRGYLPAEQSPELYHGVSPFDPARGVRVAQKDDFSAVFGQTLRALASTDNRICAVTAAMPSGTGLAEFATQYPQRFFDVGIAEAHAIAMTAGMTKQGAKPVCAIYSTFLQRAYDQLLHDVAIEGIAAVFAIDRAGIVGADGETHNGCFDVPFLRTVPNMEIVCPSSYDELRSMLSRSIYHGTKPTAIRYPRGGQGAYQQDSSHLPYVVLEPQAKATVSIITYGILVNTACETVQLLAKQGIVAQVIKLNQIGHSFWQHATAILEIVDKQQVLFLEDCVQQGSLGQAFAGYATTHTHGMQSCTLCNVGQQFLPHGSPAQVMAHCKLDAQSLAERVLKEKAT